MFGLPGETEEDAFESLEFLRRNKQHNVTVNPSACFCGFAPGTLAYDDPQRYGIDLSKGNLYWESTDGRNTYISRLKRFEDFCRLVHELKIPTTYPSTVLLDRNRSLGNYYREAGDHLRASWYFKAWLEEHPDDESILAAFAASCTALGHANEVQTFVDLLKDERPRPNAVVDADRKPVGTPCQHTDENWVNGVARAWGTALFVTNSSHAQKELTLGKHITFADNSVRTIVNTKENDGSLIVFLDGAPLDGTVVGYPQQFLVHPGGK